MTAITTTTPTRMQTANGYKRRDQQKLQNNINNNSCDPGNNHKTVQQTQPQPPNNPNPTTTNTHPTTNVIATTPTTSTHDMTTSHVLPIVSA